MLSNNIFPKKKDNDNSFDHEKNSDFEILLKGLADREKLPKDTILKMIRDSIVSSYCQGENRNALLEFKFGDNLSINRVYYIVEKVNDPSKEIKRKSPIINEGFINDDKFYLPLDTKKFSLSLNRNISEKLNSSIARFRKRDIEGGSKDYSFLDKFKKEIFHGRIIRNRNNSDYYLLDLILPGFSRRSGGSGGESNSILGYWKKEEWDMRKEEPRIGQMFFFLIKDIVSNSDFPRNIPKIIVTRQSDLFIKKVLELQIPEISDGYILIHHIIRVPKLINKVIVSSKLPGLDPLGACIGANSDRIKAITKLIFPERIDIVVQDDNNDNKFKNESQKKDLLLNLLLPVRAISLIEKEDRIVVFTSKEKILSISQDGEYGDRNKDLLKKISEYMKKKIVMEPLEDFAKDTSSLFIWNGNVKLLPKNTKNKLW